MSRAIYFDPERRVKRPSMQFYPADWQSDSKLRRCSKHLKGVWMDVLCVLHDSEEYGVCRWPLEELAMASFSDVADLRRLVEMDILRGVEMDTMSTPVTHTFSSKHKSRSGETVEILAAQSGPIWFSKRMVRDEYLRWMRGSYGKKSIDHPNVPNPSVEMDTIGVPPMPTPMGGLEGTPSSPSSASSSGYTKEERHSVAQAEPRRQNEEAITRVYERYHELKKDWYRMLRLGSPRKTALGRLDRKAINVCLTTGNYDAEDLIAALENVRNNAFHMGKTTQDGKPRLSIRNIFNVNGKVDSVDILLGTTKRDTALNPFANPQRRIG